MQPVLTIGMACYRNPVELFFTLHGLQVYHDLEGVELLVIDNANHAECHKVCRQARVRFEVYTDKVGPQMAKNKVFEMAEGFFVLCIDSHVLLYPGAVAKLKAWVQDNPEDARNLIQGPRVKSHHQKVVYDWRDKWRGGMWGTEGATCAIEDLPDEPFEVWAMGTGIFGTRKDSWLKFPPDNQGFGGAECWINEKYRQVGRKTLMLPWLIWLHNFHKEYARFVDGRVSNYVREFKELGMGLEPVIEHFGEDVVNAAHKTIFGKNIGSK